MILYQSLSWVCYLPRMPKALRCCQSLQLSLDLSGAGLYIPQGAGSGPQNLSAIQSAAHPLTTTGSYVTANQLPVSNADPSTKLATSKFCCYFDRHLRRIKVVIMPVVSDWILVENCNRRKRRQTVPVVRIEFRCLLKVDNEWFSVTSQCALQFVVCY